MKTRTASNSSRSTNLRLTAVSVAMIQAALLNPSIAMAAAPAGMTAANGNTSVTVAPNGVPVVNIAAPNAAGVSHNQYNQFNVDNRGAVLNNGDVSQVARTSQLAGQVYANPNLNGQAKVILNEVVSPNRSQLNGYVEVLGGKADVVIANPYGITCNGCGFVNTDRASLTTGTPVFGANGSLSGFHVTGGDVLVTGAGLDGKAQSYFDIVTRSLKVDGQINAQDLSISTGAHDWDYASRTGKATTSSDAAPDYAVDSTALGGMYANRIKIVANDAGVGVRMLGEAAATGSDFSIDAAGKIQLASRISAQGNLAANSTSGGIEVSGAGNSLAAHGDVTLAANNAAVTLGDAAITADGALNVSGASLGDSSTTGAARFSGGDATISVTGPANISGTSWGAGGKLTANVGSLALGANTKLYSGSNTNAANRDLSLTVASGDLDLGANSVKSGGSMTLAAQRGSVTVGTGGEGVSAGGDLNVNAQNAFNDNGNVLAGGNLGVNAASIASTGRLQAGGTATLNAATQTNSGTVIANQMNVNATTLGNSGTIQGTQGVTLALGNSLDNLVGSQIISGGDLSIGNGAVSMTRITNAGVIQANGTANLNAHTQTNTGTLSGAHTDLKADTLTNSGTVQGSQGVTLTLGSTLSNQASGQILSGDALSIDSGNAASPMSSVDNAGTIQAGGVGTVKAATITNSGTLSAGYNNLNATNLTNSGTIRGVRDIALNVSSALNNQSGAKIVSDNTLSVNADSINNNGLIQAANGATLSSNSLQNTGTGAAILTSTTGSGAGNIAVNSALNNDGAIYGYGSLSIRANSIGNSGNAGIASGNGDLTLRSTAGAISNSGALYAGGKLSINTQNGANNYDFTNERSGTIGSTDMDFKTGNFTNYNEIVATRDITLDTKGTFTNTVSTVDGVPTITTTTDYTNGMRPPVNQVNGPGTFNVYVASTYFSGSQSDVVYTETETTRDVLSSTNGLQSARLIAGRSIDMQMTGDGSNYGSLISAPSVKINMLNGGTFKNDSINLTTTIANKLWMSDFTGGDWDLYIPANITQYDLMAAAVAQDAQYGSALYPLAESGNIPCNCYTSGFMGGYPNSIIERKGQQTSIWAHLDTDGENVWNAARAAAYAKVTTSSSTVASAQIKANAGTFVFTGGTLTNTASPYTPDNSAVSSPSVTPDTHGAGNPSLIHNTNGSSFSGLNLSLPSNPNGNFVLDRNPAARYLIETNPLYAGASALGSDYLFNLLGYNPDTLEKRLGDANYEAKLVRDQLIAQTGNNILAAYDTETQQMQALLDSAYAQSHDLGLQLGVALTASQVANLKSDLVWMVEQDVNGQKVLAPVIYLAANTRSSVLTGSVIDAKNIAIAGSGLTNTGGTIVASNSLKVATTGDIVNTSGTIKGGDVSLKSTDGSVRNETFVQNSAADGSGNSIIGKQASISSTGQLDINAKNDIVDTGAKLNAASNMTLTAGRDVKATSIVNNDTTAQTAADGGVTRASIDAKNLKVQAGQDVVIAGATVKATDDASIAAKRDVTFDTVQQKSVAFSGASSGVGDNTMVTSTTVDITKQIGSTLDVGNNLKIKSGNDVTVAGSKVDVGGNADIKATNNLNVIDRQDSAVATTKTVSKSIDSGMSGVSFNETTTTSVTTAKTSVGSSINVGGNADLKAGETLTVKGSDVATGGDMNLKAKSIQVLAGESTVDTVTHTETKSQGMSMSLNSNAAGFGYNNSKTTTDSTDSSSTARVSTLTSGGNMTRTATDKITDQGTQITTGGDFTQKAKSIEMLAAENKQSSNTTSHTDSNSVGISVQYGLGTAYDNAKQGSAVGAVSASGGATVGIDFSHQTKDSNSSGNGSQAVVTTVKSGGKITSTSTQDTHLEGTDLSSKGDTAISARTLTVDAAHNTTSGSNSSTETSVGGRVSVDMSGKPGVDVNASHSDANGSSDSSTAVVGKINAGGNLKITTTGDTNLEGTQVAAKGDTTIAAGGAVNVTAARNTADSNQSNYSAGGDIGASKGAGSASVNYSSGSDSSKSSTAVTGSISAGNNVSIKSGTDIKLEGTDITAGKDATLDAKGKVDILTATSTTESNSSSLNVSAIGQGSKGQKGTKHDGQDLGAGTVSGSNSDASSTTQKVSNIKTGGDLNVKSGSTTTLEGTQADVGGKASLNATGGVVRKDVVSSSQDSSMSGGLSLAAGKGAVVGGAVGHESSHSSTSTTSVSITAHNNASSKATSSKASSSQASSAHAAHSSRASRREAQ